MASEHDRSDETWDRLLDALAESVLTASDDDLLGDVRELGQDPARVARDTKNLLMSSVRHHFKGIRQQLELEVKKTRLEPLSSARIPKTAQERRDLLGRILDLLPAIGPKLITIHHREFTELTDSDVESALQRCEALGILDVLFEQGKE